MNISSPVTARDQKEKPNSRVEVTNTEKQLWSSIHSKGLLHSDVRDLYHKICSSYEEIILSDQELTELQDVEYSIWKLHYKHIDEFRKTIKRNSSDSESKTPAIPRSGVIDSHIEGFKTFLQEAADFYKELIVKTRSHNGLPIESSIWRTSDISAEPKKLQKCQFLCHRFLVCLGDLTRYREQYQKSTAQNPNWSVSATYYLEATMVWPDSGNPQNQLAVLATYVGDEFLALYHCVRSLAVKEPFPDAWNNLILLFDRNRSCLLPFLSREAQFDFLKPSKRSYGQTISAADHDSPNCKPLKSEHDGWVETNLWPLIIRTLSFFFIKSSLEDFSSTFASTLRGLDMVIAVDDMKLREMLESYQLMDSARRGPFRALQVVAIFIFTFHNLVNSQEIEGKKHIEDAHHLELTRLALTATFILMGCLVERCLKTNAVLFCPLLPAVLVFVEWLLSILDIAEEYGADEKTTSAISYFFAAFVNLLKQLNGKAEVSSHERTALWEDYELRGFAPLAQIHVSLDFSCKHTENSESGTECRADRIIDAAKKIANRSNGWRKWINYDSLGRKFYGEEGNVISERKETENDEFIISDIEVKGLHQTMSGDLKVETEILNEKLSNHSVSGKSVVVEEEEVIVFKPLTRFNSAPLYASSNGRDPASPKGMEDQTFPSDECLRRATSVLIAQNQADGYDSDFQFDLSNFRRSKPFKQQELLVKDALQQPLSEAPISAGPPSLNAWVLNRGILSGDREKVISEIRQGLSPIEEMASESLIGLSICGTDASVTCSKPEASKTHYVSPVPSAPLLPDDAAWFSGLQSSFSDTKNSGCINKPENFYNATQVGGYSNWPANAQLHYGPPIPGFVEKFPPYRGMTSSEWLRQYRESRNIERASSHTWPVNYYAAVNPGNFPTSPSGLFDQYGIPSAPNTVMHNEPSPLHPGFPHVYGIDEQRRENLFYGYQRPSPYGCGAVTEFGQDPRPILQYLKEKEWLLQQDPTLGNHRYM
ncbi:hypothetical protein SLEP1_g22231 [Rubroshorea leprosula]|uniref:Protein SMG7L-like n=1 Tax=Rubroshorea leprosula TaxID=152421 RepID=A0AAV5JHV1_9ROSI|nr:hypothetical protein SLEP1_g22231 [Rubroshorea leprosula]